MKFYFKFISLSMIAFVGYIIYEQPANIMENLTSGEYFNKLPETPINKSKRSRKSKYLYYSYIKGDNLVQTSDESYMAERNIDLRKNDELYTGPKSVATLTFNNDSKMRLDEGTVIKISHLPKRRKTGLYILNFESGRMMMDFSDENSKYAVKFQVGNFQVYTRRSTLYLEKRQDTYRIAVDYGTAKVKDDKQSLFINEGQGVTIANGVLGHADSFVWIDEIPWDNYFHDLNRDKRTGPFTMKRPLLSARDKKEKNKRSKRKRKLAKGTKSKNNKRKLSATNDQLEKAIQKSGGGLLEKIPVYGKKIKEIKDQINFNTEAMQEREKMLEDLE